MMNYINGLLSTPVKYYTRFDIFVIVNLFIILMELIVLANNIMRLRLPKGKNPDDIQKKYNRIFVEVIRTFQDFGYVVVVDAILILFDIV